MFQKFYPDEWVDSTYVIPFEQYYEKGYRGILFDIDNTLGKTWRACYKRSRRTI